MIDDEIDDEIELCMGPDVVLHLNEKKPKAIFEFSTDDELVEFLAKVQDKLGPEFEPDGLKIEIQNTQDYETFTEKMTQKLRGIHEKS